MRLLTNPIVYAILLMIALSVLGTVYLVRKSRRDERNGIEAKVKVWAVTLIAGIGVTAILFIALAFAVSFITFRHDTCVQRNDGRATLASAFDKLDSVIDQTTGTTHYTSDVITGTTSIRQEVAKLTPTVCPGV